MRQRTHNLEFSRLDRDRRPPHQGRPEAVGGRERILEEARRLFLERGYSDVSMQQIADAAGLRKASIYHHFKDKNALFTAIVLDEMRRTYDSLDETSRGVGDLREILERIASTYLKQIRSDLFRLTTDYRQHVPESEHEEVHAELFRLAGLYERIFDRLTDEGHAITIPARYAGMFFFQMQVAWLFYAKGDRAEEIDPDEAARMVASTLLDGILPRDR
jgi:AcrR family transcriptional regulator